MTAKLSAVSEKVCSSQVVIIHGWLNDLELGCVDLNSAYPSAIYGNATFTHRTVSLKFLLKFAFCKMLRINITNTQQTGGFGV